MAAISEFYAAIDAHDPVTGAVYGLGPTPQTAIEDAVMANEPGIVGAEDSYRAVPCTEAASIYLAEHGGSPSPLVTVTNRGVCLRSEE